MEKNKEAEGTMEIPKSQATGGIDIVDYDFKGGIRVKTNRMFMNTEN